MTEIRGGLAVDRLKALSDGIFAIVLTILVLGLDVPGQDEFATEGTRGFLASMEKQLRPYVASFACVAALWLTQVVIFHYVQTCTRAFLWLNLVFFLFVSLNPFLTEMRATHAGDGFVAFLYGGVQTISFLLLSWIWHRAAYHVRGKPVGRDVVRSLDLRIFAAIGCYIIGAVLTTMSERMATLVFASVPLLFLFHRKLDDGWQNG